MKKESSNSNRQLDLSHDRRLNSNSEAIFAIEKIYANLTANRKICNHISEKEIIVGLSLIILLLLANGWQLYRSINLGVNERTYKLPKVSMKKIAKPKLIVQQNQKEIELLTIQNMISLSNF